MADALTNFTDFVIKPSAPFAAGVVLFGAVWGFFKGVESVLTDDTKLEIAVWLLGVKVGQKVEPWPETFARVFDRVFGSKHLSARCFAKSVIVTILSQLTTWLFASLHYHTFNESVFHEVLTSPLSGVMALLGGPLVLAALPDYLSLLETRIILRRMESTSSARKLVGFLCLDIVVTAITPLAYWMLWAFVVSDSRGISGIVGNPFRLDERVSSAAGDVYYPTFFTSLWLWLYAGSGFLLKAARRFDLGFDWFNRKFDIEKHPLSSIGLVAGALVAMLYWSAVIVSRVVK